jgi:hypothetical protein
VDSSSGLMLAGAVCMGCAAVSGDTPDGTPPGAPADTGSGVSVPVQWLSTEPACANDIAARAIPYAAHVLPCCVLLAGSSTY